MALFTAATFTIRNSRAQSVEGTVRVAPAISSVPIESGGFGVFIVLEDLQHFGLLNYDDNRDTVPDRHVESNGLGAFEFSIQYDAAKLAVAGVVPGPELGRTGRSFQCLPPGNEPGVLTFGCLSTGQAPDGTQGTLTLAEVSFLPVAAGSSALMLDAEIAGPLGSDNVPIDISAGLVRVTGQLSLTRTPSPTPRAGATPSATPDVPATVRWLETVTPENSATATAIAGALATARAASTATSVPTSTAPANPDNGPDNGPSNGSGNDDGSALWWWAGGLALAVLLSGLGLGGVLWQRRRSGGP